MSLVNCPRCGHVFPQPSPSVVLCPGCLKREEEDYKKVFQFFAEKPSATAQEIASETGVDIKEIFRFIRENRLQLVKADAALKCEQCGAPIRSGKYCDKCRKKLNDDLNKDIDKYKAEMLKTRGKYSISRDRHSSNIIRKRKP